MSIFTIKLIQEEGDIKPEIKRANMVIETVYNGLKMFENSTWDSWKKIFIFPDAEKAEFFTKNFKHSMHDYREGMMIGDYVFHIINCKFPEPDEIYADQLKMSSTMDFID